MNLNKNRRSLTQRPVALMLAASMAMPLFLTGCGGKKDESSAPAVDDTRGGTVTPPGPKMEQPKTGMSNDEKGVDHTRRRIAAAYFWYKHHQKAEQNADKQQYYISKANGQHLLPGSPNASGALGHAPYRLRCRWTKSEAAAVQATFKGYNNQTTGDADLKAVRPKRNKFFPARQTGRVPPRALIYERSSLMAMDFLMNQVKNAVFNDPNTNYQQGDSHGLISQIEGLFGQHVANNPGSQGGGLRQPVQSSDNDPYGDPGAPGGGRFGNVKSSDEDPYGDPGAR